MPLAHARLTRRLAMLTAGLVLAAPLAACGGDNGDEAAPEVSAEASPSPSATFGSSSASSSASGSSSVAEPSATPASGYTPVSDVDSHAAIGEDIAEIKKLLDAAKQGDEVDFAAVEKIFAKGGASKKGDGSIRTLAGLLPTPAATRSVRDAIAGTGTSAGASDAVRAQRIDKGITLLLADKMIAELEAAATKVKDDKLDAADGAPHNVDEAWAFFTAGGNGPAATADKRAADFDKEGKVREPVLAALADAQKAAGEGDSAALAEATTATRQALDYIFYLATFKYLGSTDEVGRAEGAAFYRGIKARVAEADDAADNAITGAFAAGSTAAGRAALNSAKVLAALGIDDDEKVTSMP